MVRSVAGFFGMNGNVVFLNCMAVEGNPERANAREYLLIPLSKKVYIVMTEGAGPRSVVSLCDNIVTNEAGDYVIYVFCSRESGIGDRVREVFGDDSPVKTVVVGNRVEMYLKAADVVFSKFSLFGDGGEPSGIRRLGALKIAFSKAYRSAGTAITAAKRYLNSQTGR
ncbi:MAG: hypothetical protein IJS71_07345 [Clostridia bacterium]|nr:hypothetical protein [Clostridia bacterium]